MNDIVFGIRVPEGHILKFDLPLERLWEILGIIRILDDDIGIQHISNPITGYSCPGQEDEQHGHHQECHHNLHGILHKGHHIPNLDGSIGDLMGSNPNNGQRKAVHQQHHQRHHGHHHPGDEQAGICQIPVCDIEALAFCILFVKSPDHHHARKVFAGDQVQAIDQFLHQFELGDRDQKDRDDQG